MPSPSDSTSPSAANAAADGDPAARARSRTGSLHATLALAFVPLCLVVGTGLWLVFLDAHEVRASLQRMFEELREVALTRSLLDDLHGLEQWVEAVPEARRETHALVFADLDHHLHGAVATLQRFAVADDPSAASHFDQEQSEQERIAASLTAIGAVVANGGPIGALGQPGAPLRLALERAALLSDEVEEETRSIGAELDRRSADLGQFMLLVGLASLVTVAGLGWLLHRRVLVPVRQLRAGAVALGRGETVQVQVAQRDELGELAQTFTSMAVQLQDSRRDLEQRVDERTREALRTAQLAQLGTLAAGIAHEINNPLASIVACAEGLLRDPGGSPDDPRHREYLQILQREALRARDITTRLLRLAHHSEQRHELVWLGTEIHEVAPLFAHQLADAGVALQIDAPPREPVIRGNAAEWRQVLFNLLRNALDASRRGGSVHVHAEARNGRVQLVVRDHGNGIRAADRERLFEPFFTTKAPGKGTGLGLAIVHRIVTAHGGSIRAENAPNGGAQFTIELPTAAAATAALSNP